MAASSFKFNSLVSDVFSNWISSALASILLTIIGASSFWGTSEVVDIANSLSVFKKSVLQIQAINRRVDLQFTHWSEETDAAVKKVHAATDALNEMLNQHELMKKMEEIRLQAEAISDAHQSLTTLTQVNHAQLKLSLQQTSQLLGITNTIDNNTKKSYAYARLNYAVQKLVPYGDASQRSEESTAKLRTLLSEGLNMLTDSHSYRSANIQNWQRDASDMLMSVEPGDSGQHELVLLYHLLMSSYWTPILATDSGHSKSSHQ